MMYMEIVQPKVDHSKLVELGHMIKGTYGPTTKTQGASKIDIGVTKPELSRNKSK